MRLSRALRRALRRIFHMTCCGRPVLQEGTPQRESSYAPRAIPRIDRTVLLDLPPEVLCLIIEYVTNAWQALRLPGVAQLAAPLPKFTSHPLIPLSTVNHHLRALCQPLLFRHLEFYPTGPLPPASILHHVRSVLLNPPTTDAPWELSEDYLLRMHHLTSVYWYGDGMRKQAPIGYLHLLLSSPTLQSLTMNNVWLREDGTSDVGIASVAVRALRIDFSDLVQDEEAALPELLESQLACFDSLLGALRPRLEELTLSGCAFRLSSLAAAPWPSLRLFALTRGDAILDCPWATFLAQVPRLDSFTVALGGDKSGSPLLPPTDASYDGLLPCLRHLTMTFPRPEDQIFRILPADVQSLSLRDSPRYYSNRGYYRAMWLPEPLQTASDVIRIFSALFLTKLTSLEIVYLEDKEELQMLGLLAQLCPNLRLLELHRYPETPTRRDAWYNGELRIPLDAIASCLAQFTHLRTLKLNLSFTDREHARLDATIPLDYWDRLDAFIEARGREVAARVPWLELLSILRTSQCGMRWHTWTVHHGGDSDAGGPRLVYEDIYDESFHGWKDWDWC